MLPARARRETCWLGRIPNVFFESASEAHSTYPASARFRTPATAGPQSFSVAVKRGERPIEPTQRNGPVALRLGFHAEEFSYAIDLGLPKPSRSVFSLDPEIKTEYIWHGVQLRPATRSVERRGAVVRIRRDHGEWDIVTSQLQPFENIMERIADPQRAAGVLA
jgi:predicted ATPase